MEADSIRIEKEAKDSSRTEGLGFRGFRSLGFRGLGFRGLGVYRV